MGKWRYINDDVLTETWRSELAAIENLHPEILYFGFRASCVRNWALQHDIQLPGVKTTIRPSKRQIAPILAELGYNVDNKAFRYGSERIFFKPNISTAHINNFYLFIRGEWILEQDVGDRNFVGPYGFAFDFLGNKIDRERDAIEWTSRQATQKRMKDLEQKLLEREELDRSARDKILARKEIAADEIRAALVESSHRWNRYDKDRFDHELVLALQRWESAATLEGVELSPQDALRPASHRKSNIKFKYEINTKKRLSAKDTERSGSDYGFKWS